MATRSSVEREVQAEISPPSVFLSGRSPRALTYSWQKECGAKSFQECTCSVHHPEASGEVGQPHPGSTPGPVPKPEAWEGTLPSSCTATHVTHGPGPMEKWAAGTGGGGEGYGRQGAHISFHNRNTWPKHVLVLRCQRMHRSFLGSFRRDGLP